MENGDTNLNEGQPGERLGFWLGIGFAILMAALGALILYEPHIDNDARFALVVGIFMMSMIIGVNYFIWQSEQCSWIIRQLMALQIDSLKREKLALEKVHRPQPPEKRSDI